METVRLRLERPTVRDTALVGLWQDDTVQRFLGGATDERVAWERFAGVLEHWDEYGHGACVVRERASGETAGLCGLDHPGEGFGEDVEIAYKLWPRFWGRGYATEAAVVALDRVLSGLRLERIIGITRETNLGSRRVLEKIGMRYGREVTMWGARQRLYAATGEGLG